MQEIELFQKKRKEVLNIITELQIPYEDYFKETKEVERKEKFLRLFDNTINNRDDF